MVFENKLLVQIAKHISLQIPEPLYVGHATRVYPWTFAGYKKLIGTTGCQLDSSIDEYQSCAKILAHFLRQLHNIDISTLDLRDTEQPINENTNKAMLVEALQTRLDEINESFDLSVFKETIATIIDAIENIDLNSQKPCLIHGDLYHRHLLFNDKKLTGIIDWGDMAFSHYVLDLGVVYQFLPPEVHANFFAEYGEVSPALLCYARFLGLYSAITLLWYGNGINDQRLIETSFKTLNWLLPS